MSSCSDLINELKKCLLQNKEVNIEQIIITHSQYSDQLEFFDDIKFFHYSSNIFKFNKKLFDCTENKNINNLLRDNNLCISKEKYSNIRSVIHRHGNNIITVNKKCDD